MRTDHERNCKALGLADALLLAIHHHRFNFASQLSEMGGEALVKLVLLRVRRASRDLFCIVGFGAEFLRTGLHVLHGPFTSAASSQGMKSIHLCELPSLPDGPF